MRNAAPATNRLQLDCARCIRPGYGAATKRARRSLGGVTAAQRAALFCALFDHGSNEQGLSRVAARAGCDVPAIPGVARALGTRRVDGLGDRRTPVPGLGYPH